MYTVGGSTQWTRGEPEQEEGGPSSNGECTWLPGFLGAGVLETAGSVEAGKEAEGAII